MIQSSNAKFRHLLVFFNELLSLYILLIYACYSSKRRKSIVWKLLHQHHPFPMTSKLLRKTRKIETFSSKRLNLIKHLNQHQLAPTVASIRNWKIVSNYFRCICSPLAENSLNDFVTICQRDFSKFQVFLFITNINIIEWHENPSSLYFFAIAMPPQKAVHFTNFLVEHFAFATERKNPQLKLVENLNFLPQNFCEACNCDTIKIILFCTFLPGKRKK